jgi:hypothetical protein
MDRLRALFSRQSLPKLIFIAAVYLLGRMEGEGRFTWGQVLGTAWKTASSAGGAAAESAKGLLGM